MEQAVNESGEAAETTSEQNAKAAGKAEESSNAAAEQDAKTRNILLWGGAAGIVLLIGFGLCFLAIQKKKGR